MFEDAIYYSRREADERVLAARCTDPRVQAVHQMLADKYAELAKRELRGLSGTERMSIASSAPAAPIRQRASRGIR
jgi:hypothetical protein